MSIKNLFNKLKKNKSEEVNGIDLTEEATSKSLSESIQDDEIERGLPLNEKVSNKSNVAKTAIAGMSLIAIGAIVTGVISLSSSGKDDEVANTASAASEEIGNLNPKDFNKDKEEIVLAQATSEPEASTASAELNTESASDPVVGAVDSSATVDSTNSVIANSDMQQQSTNPAMTNRIRRLGGEVVLALDNKGSSGSVQAISGINNSDSGSFNTESNGSVLNSKLNPTETSRTHAIQRGNQSMMLTKGTGIRCTLETRIVTTQPGFTRCQITSDVYSADGKVLLIERGSKIIGEQTAALLQGQARVFVLWNEVETPNGVKVSLASPGAGALGESGHGAKVNYHFWQRFGGAIMISMISDLGDSLSNKSSNGDNNNITYENTNAAAQQMATEALKNSINIPPTGVVNQGSIINVFVARDVDFSNVYDLVKRPFFF